MNIKKYYKTYRVLPPDYFYIENAGDGENTLSFYQSGTGTNLNIPIYYSFDAIDWNFLGTLNNTKISTTPIQINHTGKIFLRATTEKWGTNTTYTIINTTNNIKAGGNIMSLLYGQDFEDKKILIKRGYTFRNFFSTIASKLLSVTNLSLPATSLTDYCYSSMFDGCSSLTTAPDLPATILADYCYSSMFFSCSKLTTAPELPATTLANYCYQFMFSNCSKLTTAPVLPATTLKSYCYRYMFQNCSSLKYIKADFLTAPTKSYLNAWVSAVPSGGTFVKNPAATWENTFGLDGIPAGWTVVTE